jgi:hypothetical protein
MSEYATLEQAFGVSSFLAPEPPILRGDVGKITDARHKKMNASIKETAVAGRPGSQISPSRPPLDSFRCSAGARCCAHEGIAESIATAYAAGGAAAAWKLVPECARGDMALWYARHAVDSDFMLMVIAGLVLYVLLR